MCWIKAKPYLALWLQASRKLATKSLTDLLKANAFVP